MSDLAEIGSGGRRDFANGTPEHERERERSGVMRKDDTRRILDRVDDFSFDFHQLEAVVRALKVELAGLRTRVRDLEHDLDDFKERQR